MTTPPRGEAVPPPEPAPIRETGLGWPDERPPPRPQPSASPPPAASASPPASPRSRDVRSQPAPPRPTPPRPAPSQLRSYESQYPPQRPGTVTATAVIMFVSAGLGLLACCGLNYLASEAELDGDADTWLVVFSVVTLVFSLFNAVLGYYILQGRQWARVTTIVICALGIAGSAIALFAGANGGNNILSTCVGVLLNVLVIGLLNGTEASHYFRYSRR